jgi:hypothetical protein
MRDLSVEWIAEQKASPDGWIVIGGIFADGSFRVLEKDAVLEIYGPFPDEATADRAWREEACRKIDIFSHRLFVLPPAASR